MGRVFTRFDIALCALVILCLLTYFLPGGSIALLAKLVGYVAAFWLGLRLLRKFISRVLIPHFVQRVLWRLRNRLLVAYGFIALVPVVLMSMLAGLMLYGILGQVALHFITTELERRTAQIIQIAEWLAEKDTAERMVAVPHAYPLITTRLPGLQIYARTNNGESRYPELSSIERPPEGWGDAGGLVIRDSLLYAWANIVRKDAQVTVLLPLSSRFLGSLAPNMGEFMFMRIDEELAQPARRVRLHRSSNSPSDVEITPNRIPESDGRLDYVISWFTAYPVFLWEQPGQVENEFLRVRTRPYAVLGAVFAQKVDFAKGAIPALLLAVSIAFLIAEVIAMYIGVSITRTITGAVHSLYEATEHVREGDFSHRIKVFGLDQLATLALSFNSMTANIQRLLVVAKENERLQADLEIAKEVQAQLYPRSMPASKTLHLKAVCNPARMISGDYYDYQRLDPTHIGIAVGDVAGKGISAALLMATIQSALRTQIRHCLEMPAASGGVEVSTSKLVSQLNQHLYANTTPEKYATFCFCVYDEISGELTYTNAGHLPPILLRDGEPQLLEVNGIVVGAFPFARYQESKIQLEPGDLLLFYTDGVTEPENAYGEQYGEERLLELLRKHRTKPAEEILSLIIDQVQQWTGSPELFDDMTLLLAQRLP